MEIAFIAVKEFKTS